MENQETAMTGPQVRIQGGQNLPKGHCDGESDRWLWTQDEGPT